MILTCAIASPLPFAYQCGIFILVAAALCWHGTALQRCSAWFNSAEDLSVVSTVALHPPPCGAVLACRHIRRCSFACTWVLLFDFRSFFFGSLLRRICPELNQPTLATDICVCRLRDKIKRIGRKQKIHG